MNVLLLVYRTGMLLALIAWAMVGFPVSSYKRSDIDKRFTARCLPGEAIEDFFA
jgi:hypothetical protein